jgi:asparaginyl-tRNA synthetase
MRIKEVLSLPSAGDKVQIDGWVRTRRDTKEFSFLEVNDGSCMANLQVVAGSELENYQNEIIGLTTGSSVTVAGNIVDSPGKGQKYELQAQSIVVYNKATQDYPLQKKRHSFEFLREIAHLRPRTNTIGAISRLRSSLSYAIHTYFNERGFVYVHTPIISTSNCEGAGETFQVTTFNMADIPRNEENVIDFSHDFFCKPAALTVSGQLEAEIYALALGKVYTFGPTFRAEHSHTHRHLAEFWMVEPEMAFCRLDEDMDVAEEFLRYIVTYILENNKDDLDFFNQRIDKELLSRLETIRTEPFARISYTEAGKILEKNNNMFEFPFSWGTDLQSEHERYLTEVVFKKPVFVFDYPKEIKAFYMRLNDDDTTVGAMDLLVPRVGELIGGSEREERHDVLLKRIHELGLKEQDYWWYLDLRKFGSAPHSGFGLGLERLILFTSGMQNIRDVIPFPRFPGNAEF